MAKDLRTFIDSVKAAGPKYFLELTKPVDSNLEISTLQQQMDDAAKFPVMYFDKVKGYDMPLITNTFGSYDMLGQIFGLKANTSKDQILQEYIKRGNNPIDPVVIDKDAPCQEVVWEGADIDLNKLPIPIHAPLDEGRYVSAGFTVCKDPDTGIYNAGWYRHVVKSANQITAMINPNNHGKHIGRRYAELGRKMEVALVIGHHPAVILASCERGSIDMDEFKVMGGFLEEPVRMVKGKTIDLLVPADAEIVLEGWIDPAVEAKDGPFAEFAHYYGHEMPAYMINVTAITMRKDAIFYDLNPAGTEHNMSGVLPFESILYRAVKSKMPSLKALHLPPSGVCLFHSYISIKKRNPGEGRMAGLAAIAAESMLKMAIVVDDDIDVYNERDVMWAVATRVQGDKDIVIIPDVCGSHLDPLSYDETRLERGSMTTKVIIDATKPVGKEFATRVMPDEKTMNRISIEDYL
ncbi:MULTISPECIES: UbiD family decarboxylase [Anaerotruncus]|uniref:UbiD family decarboxylase n=2 Tax=Anaerotruncus TaxID=244127 RepID=A0A498D0A7_9FIRM|nr:MULTISPECIES: UbiD family decarboxylase [Anaerotruncus]MBC3938125.1 UbiD family decarboxylase [Anaerotruncus massiliensis (ex Togo et al. 2019)]MCQ4896277.1 UbiD family decarboxylase [Anaerotruncus sp. DFI.9.16]RLL13165.1 UbiD family decarboxylase [Anaerotruncus massiliensis (ex Liu et al. 2021)]